MKTIKDFLVEKDLDFFVEKESIYYGDGTVIPDNYALVRSDNKGFLALAKSRYQPVANRYAVSFIDEIVDDDPASTKAKIESVEGFAGGRKLQVRLRFPGIRKSFNHAIEKTVVIRNSHDLTEPISINLVVRATDTTTGKTTSATMGSKELKCRHTKNVGYKLEAAQATLDLMDNFYLGIQQDFADLDSTIVPIFEAVDLVDVVAPKGNKGLSAINRKKAESYLEAAKRPDNTISLLQAFLSLCEYINSGRYTRKVEMARWTACSKESFELTRKLFLKTKALIRSTENFLLD